MRCLVDANLPPALARWLVAAGHEAEHVTELGAERCPDRILWERARELGACVITKDEDFVLLQALDPSGPAVVWVRIGNAVSRVLLERFTVAWPAILAALERGERVVEIR